MSVYADSSFLVSLVDANSVAAARRMQDSPLPVLLLSENWSLLNAWQLRLFREEVLRAELGAAQAAFRADMRDVVLSATVTGSNVPGGRSPDAKVNRETRHSHVGHHLRGQRTCSRVDTFHTFDDKQRRLAKAVGSGGIQTVSSAGFAVSTNVPS